MSKLQVIVQEQDLSKSDVAKMIEAFGGPFEEAGTILASYKDIKVTNVAQTEDMAKAREMRLTLKKARTTVENSRKDLKADIVKQGKAIDTIARYVKEEIQPAEEYLELQEKFVQLKNEREAEALKAKRVTKLMQYTDDISVYSLDSMTVEQFDSLVETLKAQAEAKIEALKKAEEARLAEIEAEKVRQAERDAENLKLKKEAEAKEVEMQKEREANAKKEAKAQAEAKKIQDAKDAEIKLERDKREALEAETHRIVAENNAKQAEIDNAVIKEREEKEEAERQALLSPDKDKLIAFAKAVETIRTTKLPAVKTKQAQDVINQIELDLSKMFNMIMDKAKEL